MPTIRPDLSQYYSMKAVFEQILGRAAFEKLKDGGSFKDWKSESIRLLKAIAISISATVSIADEEWMSEVQGQILMGISLLESSSEIDELFSCLAATLARVVFIQIGFLPLSHRNLDRISLKQGNWKLDLVRSVQYVQTADQRKTQQRLQGRRKTRQQGET